MCRRIHTNMCDAVLLSHESPMITFVCLHLASPSAALYMHATYTLCCIAYQLHCILYLQHPSSKQHPLQAPYKTWRQTSSPHGWWLLIMCLLLSSCYQLLYLCFFYSHHIIRYTLSRERSSLLLKLDPQHARAFSVKPYYITLIPLLEMGPQ